MSDFPEFVPFPKLARLSRDIVITEKIDGTNASILIEESGRVIAGSRSRWITPADDNAGFARWVLEHEARLIAELGYGLHCGEWWGAGIQRGYGIKGKRFSLFNTKRWEGAELQLCHVVPTLYKGPFNTGAVDEVLAGLAQIGSQASLGFMRPEGVVIYHAASNTMFKKTLDKNDGHKGNEA